MLINKASTVEVGDVVGIKFITSEEIIAKLVKETDTHYYLSKPMTLCPSGQGIGLMQTMMSMNPSYELPVRKDHVLMIAPAIDQLKNHYLTTTSGIAIAR